VPTSIKLPNLEDILKMRQMPNTNGEVEETTTNEGMEETNTNGGLEGGQMGGESFVFVADYLVGAILGKKNGTDTSFVSGLQNISQKQMKHSSMWFC